jgi:hypothetical protein
MSWSPSSRGKCVSWSSALTRTETVVQLGRPPNRIDVLTGLSGLTFDDAWSTRIDGLVEGVRVPILGREALIRNKRAAGRHKDLGDVEALGEGPSS